MLGGTIYFMRDHLGSLAAASVAAGGTAVLVRHMEAAPPTPDAIHPHDVPKPPLHAHEALPLALAAGVTAYAAHRFRHDR